LVRFSEDGFAEVLTYLSSVDVKCCDHLDVAGGVAAEERVCQTGVFGRGLSSRVVVERLDEAAGAVANAS
jgi:hypothetical protein